MSVRLGWTVGARARVALWLKSKSRVRSPRSDGFAHGRTRDRDDVGARIQPLSGRKSSSMNFGVGVEAQGLVVDIACLAYGTDHDPRTGSRSRSGRPSVDDVIDRSHPSRPRQEERSSSNRGCASRRSRVCDVRLAGADARRRMFSSPFPTAPPTRRRERSGLRGGVEVAHPIGCSRVGRRVAPCSKYGSGFQMLGVSAALMARHATERGVVLQSAPVPGYDVSSPTTRCAMHEIGQSVQA